MSRNSGNVAGDFLHLISRKNHTETNCVTDWTSSPQAWEQKSHVNVGYGGKLGQTYWWPYNIWVIEHFDSVLWTVTAIWRHRGELVCWVWANWDWFSFSRPVEGCKARPFETWWGWEPNPWPKAFPVYWWEFTFLLLTSILVTLLEQVWDCRSDVELSCHSTPPNHQFIQFSTF